MTSVTLASLYTARAAIETAILAEESALGMGRVAPTEPESCPACKAPPDATAKIVSFGEEAGKRRCTVCGHEWLP